MVLPNSEDNNESAVEDNKFITQLKSAPDYAYWLAAAIMTLKQCAIILLVFLLFYLNVNCHEQILVAFIVMYIIMGYISICEIKVRYLNVTFRMIFPKNFLISLEQIYHRSSYIL